MNTLTPEQERELILQTKEKVRIFLANHPIGTGISLCELVAMWHLNELKLIEEKKP